VDSTRQSEEFGKVLARSIEQPQDLTLAEFLELDAYYLGVTDQISAIAAHYRTGYREGNPLDAVIADNVRIYFGNAFAKAWAKRHFADTKDSYDWLPGFLAAIERVEPSALEAKYRGVLQDIE
jgi:hypothetical protein